MIHILSKLFVNYGVWTRGILTGVLIVIIGVILRIIGIAKEYREGPITISGNITIAVGVAITIFFNWYIHI